MVVDVTVALAFIGTIVYIPLISSRNRELQLRVRNAASEALAAHSLEVTLSRNIMLNAWDGRSLPEVISAPLRKVIGEDSARTAHGFLLMVYTPMVCERTLNEGLTGLQESRALKHSGRLVYVIAGERSSRDRERALLLRDEKLLPYAISFLPADSLFHLIAPADDSTYDEEPIYLRVDRQLVVLSAFHADQQRPELLKAWLETLE